MTGPPENDAAPLAGGAGVKDQTTSHHCTSALRLPVRGNVTETSNVEVSLIGCRAADRGARVLAFIKTQARRDGPGRERQGRLEIKPPPGTPAHGRITTLDRTIAPEGSRAALREHLVDSPLECCLDGEPEGGAA